MRRSYLEVARSASIRGKGRHGALGNPQRVEVADRGGGHDVAANRRHAPDLGPGKPLGHLQNRVGNVMLRNNRNNNAFGRGKTGEG